ncbi:MAG: glycosyltransferase [Chlamydiota bacterium]
MAKKQTICLNMIVKNEAGIIEECLASVKKFVDSWVIVDTGSTDGTQEVIRACMADLPGELHERPWKDFAHNRNEALDLARQQADYSLFIDADERLVAPPQFKMPKFTDDYYEIFVKEASAVSCSRAFLVRNEAPLKWEGVLHEHIASEKSLVLDIAGVYIFSDSSKGNRSADPKKYLKDAWVLEEALKKEPDNVRYIFYLANSYLNAQEFGMALERYEQRAKMGGFDQEVFCSLNMIAHLQRTLGMDPEIFLESFEKAHAFRPSRAEPLFYKGNHYIEMGDFEKAYPVLKRAALIPPCSDCLFINQEIGNYMGACLFYACCWRLKKYEEAKKMCEVLLLNPSLPSDVSKLIYNDLVLLQKEVG